MIFVPHLSASSICDHHTINNPSQCCSTMLISILQIFPDSQMNVAIAHDQRIFLVFVVVVIGCVPKLVAAPSAANCSHLSLNFTVTARLTRLSSPATPAAQCTFATDQFFARPQLATTNTRPKTHQVDSPSASTVKRFSGANLAQPLYSTASSRANFRALFVCIL